MKYGRNWDIGEVPRYVTPSGDIFGARSGGWEIDSSPSAYKGGFPI